MSCTWVNAKFGYKWALTELGLEDSRIRSKFEEKFGNKKQYEQAVPKTWIEKGLVQEVKK